ncbi:MAG: cupin domain-containing protein [Mucilaginibacter sp.]|uniref:cupin domain-containing protein n=1 Tax=Mucilaginibacter sp. TaxID=1882438 RepID=UPI0031B4CF87
MKNKLFIFCTLLSTFGVSAYGQTPNATLTKPVETKHTVILDEVLHEKGFDNKSVQMMIVDFPPMSTSAAHKHPCPTFGYVLSGEIVSVVEGQTYRYKAGDYFSEVPNRIHNNARNESRTVPAKLLVFFIKDTKGATMIPANK